MSDRIFTSGRGEETLKALTAELDPEGLIGKSIKWRTLRLALAVSIRLPINPGDNPVELRPEDRSKGAEYRLVQVTGLGKSDAGGDNTENEDLTDSMRAMLSVLHHVDLFHPTHRETTFGTLLEHHIDRGLAEIARYLATGTDVLETLITLLTPPNSSVTHTVSLVVGDRLVAAFAELGITVELSGPPVDGPRLTHYSLHVPDAQDLDRIATGLHRLAFVLGMPADVLQIEASIKPKTLILLVPRPRETWEVPGYTLLQEALTTHPESMILPLCLGVDTRGEPVVRDLAQAPHLLIGGTTGSGKSVALHALLCGLLATPPAGLQLWLCDAKGTELTAYRDAPQVGGRVATSPDEIRQQIEALVAEMDRRYPLLQGRGLRDLAEGRKQGLSLPYIVMVVDEVADLLLQAPGAEDSLVRLAQKGRAAGLHLILATQRPDARTLSGLLRSNIPARVALAVQRATESQIILGEAGAQALTPPGDMLIRWASGERIRAHGFDLRPDDVSHAVRAAKRANS